MAIDFDSGDGLFDRLGRIGKLLYLTNTHQAALPAALDSLITKYDETTPPGLRDAIALTIASVNGIIANQIAWMPTLASLANTTLLRMVRNDVPSSSNSIGDAVREVIAQMVTQSKTVKASTTSVSIASVLAAGDGQVVGSTKLPNGTANELVIPEVAKLVCRSDSYTGNAVAGNESFQFISAPNTVNAWNYDWPGGSNGSATFTAISPTTGTVVTNGDLETWEGSPLSPSDWTVSVGTAGTNIVQETTTIYDGSYSAKIVGGATLTAIYQAVSVLSSTPYALGFWIYLSGVPAAGVLTVELVDSAGTVLTDDAGTNLSTTVTLSSSAATTWIPCSAVFITPRSLPSEVRLRVRISTALSAGTNLFVDRIMLGAMTRAYTGGPYFGVLSGATPFAVRDAFTATVANNRGGASYNATFQALFDRFFGMRAIGVQLPSDASPNIADTLITS